MIFKIKNRLSALFLCASILLLSACSPDLTQSTAGSTEVTRTSQTTEITQTSTTQATEPTSQTSATTGEPVTTTTPEATTTVTTTTASSTPATTTTTSVYIPPSGGFNETGRVKYVFNNLNQTQLSVYNQLAEGVKNNYQQITLNTSISVGDFEAIVSLLKDYEFMYTHIPNNYVYTINQATGNVSKVEFTYAYSKQQSETMTNELKAKVDEIIKGIPVSTEFDKIVYLHDFIIKNCNYDLNAENIYTAYGALVDGKAVCEGYSKAMALLCNSIGIDCILVTGTAKGQPHMWNMIKYNGEWYHMDLTWDDPVGSKDIFDDDYVQYDYFNITTDQIMKDHTVINETYFFKLPTAYSTEGNYFIRTDTYARSVDDSLIIVDKELRKAVLEKKKAITFKAATQTLFNDINDKLFTEREIFELLGSLGDDLGNGLKTYTYGRLINSNYHVITIFLDYE